MTAHRMDQETLERLLVGPVAGAHDGPEVLRQFLAAVRAAPRPHELDGEGSALQAFRAARTGSPPVAPHRPAQRLFPNLLGAKIALAALLAAATGGVALAATTAVLEGPAGGDGGSSTSPGTTGGRASSPATGPGASPTPSVGPSARPGSPSSLAPLCVAYRSRSAEGRQNALASPPFAELVEAAGGRDEVADYCDRLLGGPDGRNAPSAPVTGRLDGTRSGRPDGPPAGRPGETPNGRPEGTATLWPRRDPSTPPGARVPIPVPAEPG